MFSELMSFHNSDTLYLFIGELFINVLSFWPFSKSKHLVQLILDVCVHHCDSIIIKGL